MRRLGRLAAAAVLLLPLGGARPAAGVPARAAAGRAAAPRLTIARLQYEGGGDWYANPSSLPNLLEAIARAHHAPRGPHGGRVTLDDDRIFDYPFVHATGHGNIHFSDAEIVRLRAYLERGGFLHVDDNYGLDPYFRREIRRVFPGPAARRRAVVAPHLSHSI